MNKFTNQLGELLLTDADGAPLEIISGLIVNANGDKAFLVGNPKTREKWNHCIRTELTESDQPFFPTDAQINHSVCTLLEPEPDFNLCRNCRQATGITKNFKCTTCGENICVKCGCTDSAACEGGCDWTSPGHCSQCYPAIGGTRK